MKDRNNLTNAQRIQLIRWIEKNDQRLTESSVTVCEAADIASQELGFQINPKQMGRMRNDGDFSFGQRRSKAKSDDADLHALVMNLSARVMNLELAIKEPKQWQLS